MNIQALKASASHNCSCAISDTIVTVAIGNSCIAISNPAVVRIDAHHAYIYIH